MTSYLTFLKFLLRHNQFGRPQIGQIMQLQITRCKKDQNYSIFCNYGFFMNLHVTKLDDWKGIGEL